MDQIKTGKFIADERKKKGYTQRQLAEQLGISDKTISKWARGNGFPEISLLVPLCNELDLSVNELLTGERISETEYREKAEENMVNLVKEAQESKKKIILSGMISALVISAATPMFEVAGAFPLEDWMLIALIAVGAAAGGYYFKVYKPKHEYDDEDEMEEDEDESEDSESEKREVDDADEQEESTEPEILRDEDFDDNVLEDEEEEQE